MAAISLTGIDAFDAAQGKRVTFSYTGNQCIANRLIVYDSATNSEVYNSRQESFALSHTIAAGSLTNGVLYYLKITAYYMEGNEEKSVTSSASNNFYCLSTPTWAFSDITNGQIIGNSSLLLTMTYSQAQNEEVNEFAIVVYTASRSIYSQSGALYSVSSSYTVEGLADNTVYYLRAYGTTVNGLYFDTRTDYPNDIEIHVDYISPEVYSLVFLENVRDRGYIRISTNIASIEGRTESGEDVVYINGTEADLREDMVIFDDNVLIQDEFNMVLTCRDITLNGILLDLGGEVIVSWRKQGEAYFAELKCSDGAGYVLYSSPIYGLDGSESFKIRVGFTQGFYTLSAEVAV